MEQSPFAVILRAADKEETRTFYELLGLRFSEHRHGNGPLHYACDFNGAVLEIYQGRKRTEETKGDWREAGQTTLYVELPPDIPLERVAIVSTIVQVIREHALVVLRDPDGRAVMVAKPEEENA